MGNSCPHPHSPECQTMDNFSPWMEMAPSHSSLPQVPCPMHLTPYTLLILMIWIFTILSINSFSLLYLWRFNVWETYTHNQASVSHVTGALITLYRNVPLHSLFLFTCSLHLPLTTPLSAFNMTKVETIVKMVTPSENMCHLPTARSSQRVKLHAITQPFSSPSLFKKQKMGEW
jgi:hypothetical protein